MKRITRANIMGELVDKFSLEEHEREDFLFGEFVVPTYDVGAHVKHWVVERNRKTITGNGDNYVHSVPSNERWRMRRVVVINEAGGNFDIEQIYFYADAVAFQHIFYDTTTPIAAGTVNIFAFPQDVIMEKGGMSSMHFNVVNYVAGGYVSIHVLKEVEILR